MPAGREGSGRRWALADRWFRKRVGRIPEHAVALRHAAVRSLRALGTATQKQVKLHFVRHRYQGLATVWKDLETKGEIIPVKLDANGKPLTGIVGVTFYLYRDQQDGSPLWMETQNVLPPWESL